jgi:H/ACA ribonucleoprotein complex subunit 4
VFNIRENEIKTVAPPDLVRKTYELLKDDTVTTKGGHIHRKETGIKELLSSGVINLNKPMGPTSHQVSSWAKHIFGVPKLGHGGTLDPRVTGVLPLAFGRSTKLLSMFKYASKEYVGVMRLHQDVPIKKVELVSKKFIGPIYQTPPVRSAVKRQLRVRTIYSFEILEQSNRDVLFKVVCEAGTYIRSLVNDLGLVLGKGAHMQELRRSRSGAFHEKDSVTLHDLKDAMEFWKEDQDESLLRKYVKPMEHLLLGLPKVIIHDSAVDAICHGADLARPGIIQFEDFLVLNEPVAILTRLGEGVAIGEVKMITNDVLKKDSGIVVKTTRVLMDPGTYQKGWKSKNEQKI